MCGGEVGDTGADPTGDTTGDPTGEGTGARITAMDGITDTVRIPDAGGTAGAGYVPRGESLLSPSGNGRKTLAFRRRLQ